MPQKRRAILFISQLGLLTAFSLGGIAGASAPPTGFPKLLFRDDFERTEANPDAEQPGNNWGTNSQPRAQGVKQVFLRDGAAFIKMADVADHGVSFTQDVSFADAVIRLRFKLGKGDDLGINIADMQEKSVHAGHICMPRIRLDSLEIRDLKTGRMKLEMREKSQAKALTAADKKFLATKEKKFPLSLKADAWHDLEIRLEGETLTILIDGKQAGDFSSLGIGHPTKRRIRVAVNREAWIDDVEVFGR
jgi:hypothetical protein